MIVLDTHAWIWLASNPERLSGRARRALNSDRSRAIAAISCWEVAMLVVSRRIELDRDPITWMEDSFHSEHIDLLPLTPAVAVASTQLQALQGDPADRLIVATALAHGAMLVTKDDNMQRAGIVRTVW